MALKLFLVKLVKPDAKSTLKIVLSNIISVF
jgi:hypothetical protein